VQDRNRPQCIVPKIKTNVWKTEDIPDIFIVLMHFGCKPALRIHLRNGLQSTSGKSQFIETKTKSGKLRASR
jgi:hypothetical protein